MKIKIRMIIFLIIVASLFTLSTMNGPERLNIVGSTSIQPICEELYEKYAKSHQNIDVNIQGGGSSLGVKSTKANVAEIGMCSKEINDSNLIIHELGREGMVIILNNNNSVNDLSKEEIRDIFSGKINKWEDGSKINVIVREEGSGTLNVFKDKIMDGVAIKKGAIVQNSAGSVKQSVMQDRNAIGFVSLNHLDSNVKNISINGVCPSEENILNEEYPLQRPFLLLTNKTPNYETMEFINWTKTDEVKKILKSEKIFVRD